MDAKTLRMAKTICGLPYDCATCRYAYDMYMIERVKCHSERYAEVLVEAGYGHKSEVAREIISKILYYCDTHKPLDEKAFGAFLAELEERMCK